MNQEIISNIENPRQLEKLYRENKSGFRRSFNSIYPEVREHPTAQIWNERLNFDNDEISWGSTGDIIFVVIAACIAALLAKLPEITGINEDFYFPRNIGFIIFPVLTAWFLRKKQVSIKQTIIIFAVMLISIIYINLLPNNDNSDTLVLACIHLPLLLWATLGYVFTGNAFNEYKKRIDFLKYNSNLVVMGALMVIAGGIVTGVTIGLFSLIQVNIEEFYFKYIVISGMAALPIVATFIVQTNPRLVSKVSPVIAKLFSPIVMVMLVIYLVAIVYSGKDPYNDREFLMLFNVLLIGVMALILFSVAETSGGSGNKIETVILTGLSIVTIIVNGIALSAIVFRISEWGITPNRLAVLGSNLLMLIHLLHVTYRLFAALKNRNEIYKVENIIAAYLPVYAAWTILVIFIFPVLFNFK